jgi:quinol monooxygenase YgiN
MRVLLHLRFRVQPGRREEFLAFLRDAVPFYEAPGGIRIGLLQDVADPDRFIEVVEYADEETYQRDQARVGSDPGMRGYLSRWRELLALPLEMEVLHDLGGSLQREEA